MKDKVNVIILLMICSVSLYAQETESAKPQILINLSQNNGEGGRIEIIQPVQVENLLKMQIANNRLQEGIPGYRIQIFSQSGQTARARADETRMNFMRIFPEIEAYRGYNTPYFKVFAGDFRTKNEAFYHLKKIQKIFPQAFIVSDIIHIQ